MSNYWKVYWLTRLDAIHNIFAIVACLLLIGCFIWFIVEKIEVFSYGEQMAKNKTRRNLLIIGSILGLIACFTPSKNEAIIIMAGGATMDYIQSDSSLQQMPDKATEILSEMLDNKLRELKKTEKND